MSDLTPAEQAVVDVLARTVEDLPLTNARIASRIASRIVAAVRPYLAPAGFHDGVHQYLSTGCLHGNHGYCKGTNGMNGAKRPASCKFCGAPCQCPCHQDGDGNA